MLLFLHSPLQKATNPFMEFKAYNFATQPHNPGPFVEEGTVESYENSQSSEFAVHASMLRAGESCSRKVPQRVHDPATQHLRNVLQDGLVCHKPINSDLYGCWDSKDVAPRGKADAPSFHRNTKECLLKCDPYRGPLAPRFSTNVPKNRQLCVVNENQVDPKKLDAAMTGLNELWPLAQAPVPSWGRQTYGHGVLHSLQGGSFTDEHAALDISSYLNNQNSDQPLDDAGWGWATHDSAEDDFLTLSAPS